MRGGKGRGRRVGEMRRKVEGFRRTQLEESRESEGYEARGSVLGFRV